jgi:hypothetical protein
LVYVRGLSGIKGISGVVRRSRGDARFALLRGKSASSFSQGGREGLIEKIEMNWAKLHGVQHIGNKCAALKMEIPLAARTSLTLSDEYSKYFPD